MMIEMEVLEIINWAGSVLTVMGTFLISLKKPRVLWTNILYIMACVCLLTVFIEDRNLEMVIMYCILAVFSLIGIVNQLHGELLTEEVEYTIIVKDGIKWEWNPTTMQYHDRLTIAEGEYRKVFYDDDHLVIHKHKGVITTYKRI